MGNDGGSIPDRRDLVRSKPKAEQADKANQIRARWFFCALSKKPLAEPIVSCALGKLYNKDAILEYLLDKSTYGDGEEICGHIRSLKDVKTLKLTHNTIKASRAPDASSTDVAQFMCPLNLKEMNGSQPFVFLWTCGCVFSQAGLRALSRTPPPKDTDELSSKNGNGKEKAKDEKAGEEQSLAPSQSQQLDICPQCATKYDKSQDVLLLNPSPADEAAMRDALLRRRAAEPVKKGKKRKAAELASASDAQSTPKAKAQKTSSPAPQPSINPNISTASRKVVEDLAEEEAKRKAAMSDAVRSLYAPKDGVKRKETFMTMGTFTRYA